MKSFEDVKTYLSNLDLLISQESAEDQLLVADNEEQGIMNLMITCDDPVLVIEQIIMKTSASMGKDDFIRLLQINRDMVHGAFSLDESKQYIIFRDTLQLENLDQNELEGSINSLSLTLAEYSGELIDMAKH